MTNVEPKRRRLVPGAPLTVGFLAGWQFYRTPTPFNYLSLIFRGIRTAARDHGVNLLLACGMGTSADPAIPPRPAYGHQPNLLQTGALITLVLSVTIFFLAQRVFMQGIVFTGVEK